jgi:hypothetical protein
VGKRNIRKAIDSLRSRIEEHEQKVRMEMMKAAPDGGAIEHWRREIELFNRQLEHAQLRLSRRARMKR